MPYRETDFATADVHTDPHALQRFIDAQDAVYPRVQAELCSGRKSSHWMWFIFPQWAGLGRSAMAQRYAIGSLAEAKAYATHPLLGRRLQECTRLAIEADAVSAFALFGHPDDVKFQSSMTLFAGVDADCRVYAWALERFFEGARDAHTQALLDRTPRHRPKPLGVAPPPSSARP